MPQDSYKDKKAIKDDQDKIKNARLAAKLRENLLRRKSKTRDKKDII